MTFTIDEQNLQMDRPDDPYQALKRQVIDPGLCTHCGTCVGLSHGRLRMPPTRRGPLPFPEGDANDVRLPAEAYLACPGRGVHYPLLNRWVFGKQPDDWLIGVLQEMFVGFATDDRIRSQAASGGVITQTLIYLLESDRIQGAVVLQQGEPKPWLATPKIARTRQEIIAASQSVYSPSPVNVLLDQMQAFDGVLAYVGLPDQVAALRRLQHLGHPGASRVKFVLGPYVGTAMYLDAIRSFLRSHGIRNLDQVTKLRYREGEWPGYLSILLENGRELRAPKFYYNYLIPFFITTSSLLSVDFTNELSDISVGDAWRPDLERQGGGHSVVIARSPQALSLLQEMQSQGLLHLEPTPLSEGLAMHAHMLDFKKRGAFLRTAWRRKWGLPSPEYGYELKNPALSRMLVEVGVSGLLILGRNRFARWLIERMPLSVVGPLFNSMRKTWKAISKSTKRKALWQSEYKLNPNSPAELFHDEPIPDGQAGAQARRVIEE